MGSQVVIRDVGGANGTIGPAEVVRALPAGQTFLMTSMGPIAIQPSFMARAPCCADQLTAVCLVAEAPATLMTQTWTGIGTVADLVARAKANPGQLPYATGGVGALGNLAVTGMSCAFGIEMNHIPFCGSGDSVQAMLSGTVPMLTAEAISCSKTGCMLSRLLPNKTHRILRTPPPYAIRGLIWPTRFGPGTHRARQAESYGGLHG